MSSYRCCDCGEIKTTKCDLEAHLNADHIGWTPYQCFYCCQQGVSTRKPNKEMLREHVTERHPDQQFTFLCTDDQIKEDRLKDMLNRSMTNEESMEVTSTTMLTTITTPNPDENVSPFVISLSASPHLQPKQEGLILEETEDHSPPVDMNTLTQAAGKKVDDVDVKQNFSALGNCRCGMCKESVPRNLVLIRDHVKLHFKEKTGCVPADLTKILPNLQQLYCQLLMTSFPSVSGSILDDDIPDHKAINQKEMVDNGMTQKDSMVEFPIKEDQASTIYCQLAQISSTVDHHSPTYKASSLLVSCDVCLEKFASTLKMHIHRASKHGIKVQYHCKQCKCDLSSGGGSGYQLHLLQEHLHKHNYECSLCGNTHVRPRNIDQHDRKFHGGLGKAEVINNMHHHKTQLETLRKELIIDLSHRSTSWIPKKSKKSALHNILCLKRNHSLKSRTEKHSKNIIAKAKPKTTLFSCEICNKTTPTLSGLKSHRNKKHGILVKWHCKECKRNLVTGGVKEHLLTVHTGKTTIYECGLCEMTVEPRTIGCHDKQFHGGLGKAKIVNNQHRYKEQLEDLEKKWIIDLNSSISKETDTTTRIPKALKIELPYVTCHQLRNDYGDRLSADGSKGSENTGKIVPKK